MYNIYGMKTNIINPVSRFAFVCRRLNFLCRIQQISKTAALVTAIRQIHAHIQASSFRQGRILAMQIAVNMRSAMLSSAAPAFVAAPNFLAKKPSNTSVRPHSKYTTKNLCELRGNAKSRAEPAILKTVSKLGIYFKLPFIYKTSLAFNAGRTEQSSILPDFISITIPTKARPSISAISSSVNRQTFIAQRVQSPKV